MVMPTSLANKRMEVANFIFRQGIGGGELDRILLKIYIKRSEGGGERGSRGIDSKEGMVFVVPKVLKSSRIGFVLGSKMRVGMILGKAIGDTFESWSSMVTKGTFETLYSFEAFYRWTSRFGKSCIDNLRRIQRKFRKSSLDTL